MTGLIAVDDERIMEYNAAVETTTRWLGGPVAMGVGLATRLWRLQLQLQRCRFTCAQKLTYS